MPGDPTPDINQTIISAVNARIEAEVAAALLTDDAFGKFVTAALQGVVEIPDGTSYGKKRVRFIDHLVQRTVAERTKTLVTEVIGECDEQIRTEVRKALRKSIGVIADQLVDGFVEHAAGRYPSISVEFKGRDD